LIDAGLLARSFWQVSRVDPGFDAENVLTIRLRLPDAKYDKAEKMLAFYEETIRRVAALPGVRGAGVTNGFPLGNADSDGYSIEGQPASQPGEEQQCIVQSVSPAYHQVFGIGLLSGRYFTPQDNATSPPVVIVDEDFARKHFPTLPLGEVVGKRLVSAETICPGAKLSASCGTSGITGVKKKGGRRFTAFGHKWAKAGSPNA